MGVQMENVFPDNRFAPGVFSPEERRWLKKHVGEKPSVMNEDPPPQGSSVQMLQVALQRLFDDDNVDLDLVKKSLDRSLRLYKRIQQDRQIHGKINLNRVGIGTARGQMNRDLHFAVPLTPIDDTPEDFYEGYLDEKTVTDRDWKKNVKVYCPYCERDDKDEPYFYEGPIQHLVSAMHLHVHRVHEDDKKDWNVNVKPTMRKRYIEGR